jgi:energy-coupling factor transporter ATP-binding protein EcfA2
MLHNINIERYRLFKSFSISSLAQVNLIVGGNNSGKSSLLEAVHLLSSDDVRSSLMYLLGERGEFASGMVDPRFERSSHGGYQISNIFYGRLPKSGQSISIFSTNKVKSSLRLALLESKDDSIPEQNQLSFFPDDADFELASNNPVGYLVFERSKPGAETSRVSLKLDEEGLLVSDQSSQPYLRQKPKQSRASRFITTNYPGYDELANLWDKITLTPKEAKVVEALQILEPKVKRISFTSRQTSNSGILLSLEGQSDPNPLGSMGDGMRRILAIVASLVSVDKGTLLVDEIDTGLHHTALKNMWQLIFETTYKQDAQVFATTHSWDCVKAFQQAISEFRDPEIGRLIRLEQRGDEIVEVSYLADELNIAVDQGIEVR